MIESWLSKNSDSNNIGNQVPQLYKIIHTSRPKGRGGVGVVFRDTLDLQMQQSTLCLLFEFVEVLLKKGNDCIRLAIIYHQQVVDECHYMQIYFYPHMYPTATH